MKKRLMLITAIILMGIISIELFARFTSKPDYYNMNYEIIYKENKNVNQRLLFETSLFQIYATHYDEDSYILFENKDKLSIPESLQNGYILLGDLYSITDIYLKANYTLDIVENKDQELVKRYSTDELEIYYFKIDNMKLISNDSSINSSVLEVFESNSLSIDKFIQALETDANLKISDKTNDSEYTLYEYTTYNIKIKNDLKEIILGNKELSL